MMNRVWVVWLVVACSGPSSQPPAMVVVADCAGSTDAAFPDTALGQTAHAMIVARREDGDSERRVLRVSIDGPDAASFAIEDQSSCVSLPGVDNAPGGRPLIDGETCSVGLAFLPSVAGAQHAVLHLGATDVLLTATGLASAPGLVATLRNVAMLGGVLTTGSEADFVILNQGSTPITLGEGSVSGPGLLATNWELAGNTIVPGGGIPARLELFQSTPGCTTGTFRIATSDATLAIPITSRLLGGVALSYFGGAGDGRVVSSPPGIDCHGGVGMCTWVFSDERVELTATPDVGNHFTGWLGGCGSDPTCAGASLPSPSGHDLVLTHAAPYFASAKAKAVTLHITGSGAGDVADDGERVELPVTCTHDCTMWIEPGTPLALHVQTPSAFGGWSGACTGTDKSCDLGVVTGDRDVTAVLSADDRETTTSVERSAVELAAGAYASDGDLVVTGLAQFTGNGFVRRQAPDGTVRWSIDLQPDFSPSAVAVDPTGAIYASTQLDGLVKLSATGEILWTSRLGSQNLEPAALSILPDGRVALLAGTQSVVVLDANGAPSWVADLGPCVGSAVAASPANLVAVACADGTIERFDAAGAALAAWTIPDAAGQTHTVSMAFDATGSLFLHATRLVGVTGSRVIARLDATGAPAFIVIEPVAVLVEAEQISVARPGLRIASNRQAFLYLSHHARSSGMHLSTTDTGGIVQTFTSAGVASWMVDKPAALGTDAAPAWDTLSIADAACDAANHCALVGSYADQELNGWVEVFATP
jgi:PQQ-like domain/Divergent InlB B-repeat domain